MAAEPARQPEDDILARPLPATRAATSTDTRASTWLRHRGTSPPSNRLAQGRQQNQSARPLVLRIAHTSPTGPASGGRLLFDRTSGPPPLIGTGGACSCNVERWITDERPVGGEDLAHPGRLDRLARLSQTAHGLAPLQRYRVSGALLKKPDITGPFQLSRAERGTAAVSRFTGAPDC